MRPSLAEALTARAEQTADNMDAQTRAACDMTADVRATAERIDAEPALLDVLGERQRNEVERYRTWRAVRDARANDDNGGDAA